MHITLGPALLVTKGLGGARGGTRLYPARELCQQVGETPQLFPVLWGLWWFYMSRAQLRTARELGEHSSPGPAPKTPRSLLEAHRRWWVLVHLGEFALPAPTGARYRPL